MRPDEVRSVARSCRRIDGWFSAEAAQLFGLVDEVQRRAGIAGDLFEIGVHHGRSAVLLAHMARAGERVGVCDLFGGQGENVSGSGSGDRAVFEANMAALAPPGRLGAVFERRSDELAAEELGGPYRVFHIDGGHLLEEALGDLLLGASVLHEGGVLILDDPFRPEWPGVTEAALAVLSRRPELAPIALGFNKLVLARRDARGIYDAALAAPWERFDRRVWESKELPLAGSPVRIFFVPSYRRVEALERPVARVRWVERALRARLRRER
jgi:Methyltransferase domain